MTSVPNTRRSITELQKAYDSGDKQPLEDVVRAWKGIQELPVSDPRSFFVLGGYHGEPFQYRQDVTYLYWGGWCNHGNILFPTWHRVYLYQLEKALQSIVPGVTLPYWDETSPESLAGGVPSVFTSPTFELDNETIPNPLYSFTFPVGVTDQLNEPTQGDPVNEYTKPAGYQTVRYPLSGLVGTPQAQAETAAHNAQYTDPVKNAQFLDDNVEAWLAGAGGVNGPGPTPQTPNPVGDGIYWMFQTCLSAPNYTVFSNTTSAGQWNTDNPNTLVVPVEQPHNDIHLSIGGFDIPPPYGGESGQLAGANGDMGENNTAGLDPIFFFHHCNVDRMFWVWQKKNGFTDSLGEIIAGYPGTNSSDSQGPTPDYAPDTPLGLDSGLYPFTTESGATFTSNDAVNIETQLGYTYDIGSLDTPVASLAKSPFDPPPIEKKLAVTGLDRSLFRGSFVVRAYAVGEDDTYYLGHHSVLNRNNTATCANCLNHLEVKAHFPLNNIPMDERDKVEFKVAIQHRGHPGVLESAGVDAAADAVPKRSAALPSGLAYQLDVVD